MTYASRSPRVVGAHFFARYGYDEAVGIIASKLNSRNDKDHEFWKQVMDVLEVLQANENAGQHPCAALPIQQDKTKHVPVKPFKNL